MPPAIQVAKGVVYSGHTIKEMIETELLISISVKCSSRQELVVFVKQLDFQMFPTDFLSKLCITIHKNQFSSRQASSIGRAWFLLSYC